MSRQWSILILSLMIAGIARAELDTESVELTTREVAIEKFSAFPKSETQLAEEAAEAAAKSKKPEPPGTPATNAKSDIRAERAPASY